MDFVTLMIKLLKSLSVVGGFGVGIILLTVVIRVLMWPLGVSQQRSMRIMQTLQPKMKAIQDRYKNDPQLMQKKMMDFYKEHKFNPMAGCFPLLIQMPIFILLYILKKLITYSANSMKYMPIPIRNSTGRTSG